MTPGAGEFEAGTEFELEEIARQERDARLALAAARERNKMDDGEAPHESLISKLEAEWKEAVERLERARKS
jgi:hypothetical protein